MEENCADAMSIAERLGINRSYYFLTVEFISQRAARRKRRTDLLDLSVDNLFKPGETPAGPTQRGEFKLVLQVGDVEDILRSSKKFFGSLAGDRPEVFHVVVFLWTGVLFFGEPFEVGTLLTSGEGLTDDELEPGLLFLPGVPKERVEKREGESVVLDVVHFFSRREPAGVDPWDPFPSHSIAL